MEFPNKRLKPSNDDGDFLSLSGNDIDEAKAATYGYGDENGIAQSGNEPRGLRLTSQKHDRRVLNDPRHIKDKPKSKHSIPGQTDWILVNTKYNRRFVHNLRTKQSLWRIPLHLKGAIADHEQQEDDEKEKGKNAKWAEEQFQKMEAEKMQRSATNQDPNRRRRSESLQREDEEAFMRELAAEASKAGETPDEEPVDEEPTKEGPRPGDTGWDSEGSFEYVEVTDTEGEDNGDESDPEDAHTGVTERAPSEPPTEEPVEFGEDDIAYQLAAMGEEYGLDPGEYGEDVDENWEEGAEGLPLTEEDAIHIFRDLLDDHGISPFTPWESVIADESEEGIMNDDRYTALPNMKARKEVFGNWAREKAAQVRTARAQMEQTDPRIAYLDFLSDKATPKLYWPEFKRKYKRDAQMNDRKLADKDREKLYRDHITRMKLPESTRRADLVSLLKSVPIADLHKQSTLDSLPQKILVNLHYISLPPKIRDQIISSHIRSLPVSDRRNDGLSAEQAAAEDKKRTDRRRREAAFEARERAVAEQKRNAEKAERMARRELRDEERELQRAMK